MGLKAQGFGAVPQTLVAALEPKDKELESILNLPLDKIELPKKKTELHKLAQQIEAGIKVLEQHVESSDGDVAKSAKQLLGLARAARLDIEGRIMSWVVEELAGKTDASGQPRQLENHEAAALFALFGNVFSNGEMDHAVETLKGRMDPAFRRGQIDAVVDGTVSAADKMGRRTSGQSLGIFGGAVIPVLGSLAAARTFTMLANVEPAVSVAVNLLAIQAGFQLGYQNRSTSMSQKGFAFGVNRFQGEVDHDLVMLFDRATGLQGRLWQGKLDDKAGQQLVDNDIALIRMITSARRESWNGRDVPALERTAVERFEKLANQLEQVGVDGARGGISGLGMKKAELAKLPSLPEIAPHARDAESSARAFRTVLSETAKGCLAVTNASLGRLITMLEERHADGSAVTAGELETIRRYVGGTPSVAEVLGLANLASKGVVDFKALWPEGEIRDLGGNVLSKEDAKLVFETLGDRDKGASLQKWAQVISVTAPFLAAFSAYAAASAMGFGDFSSLTGVLATLGVIGASLATHIGGFFAARAVDRKGANVKLMQGVDLATAVGNEYALVLPKYFDPEALLSGDVGEVRAKLSDEVAFLDVVLASVQTSEANLQKALAELDRADGADNPDAARQREDLREELAVFAGAKQFHYDVLGQVRNGLAEMVTNSQKPGATVAETREAFAELRKDLLALMQATWQDVAITQGIPEFTGPMFFHEKLQLLDTVKTGDLTPPIAKDIVDLARNVVERRKLFPKDKRPDKDALDDIANAIVKEKSISSAQLQEVGRPAYEQSLRTQRIEVMTVSTDRAGDIGQEVVNALWSQVYEMYGLVPESMSDKPPKLKGVDVKIVPNSDPTRFGEVQVTGRLDGGGKFAVTLDASGRPAFELPTITMDLGARRLGSMAEEYVRNHVEALTGNRPSSARATLVGRSDDNGYRYTVDSGGRRFDVVMPGTAQLDKLTLSEVK